jgi:hypothetical protein
MNSVRPIKKSELTSRFCAIRNRVSKLGSRFPVRYPEMVDFVKKDEVASSSTEQFRSFIAIFRRSEKYGYSFLDILIGCVPCVYLAMDSIL